MHFLDQKVTFLGQKMTEMMLYLKLIFYNFFEFFKQKIKKQQKYRPKDQNVPKMFFGSNFFLAFLHSWHTDTVQNQKIGLAVNEILRFQNRMS